MATLSGSDNKYEKFAKCKQCGNTQLAKAARLKLHHEKCAKVSMDMVHDDVRPADDVVATTSSVKRERSTSPLPTKRQAISTSARSTQPSMDESVVKTSDSFKSAMDMQIARLFYGCNLPFNIVENPVFVKTINMLRPGYKHPTRKAIAGTLLDTVHDEVCEDMRQSLDGKTATLVQDGWSHCHNEAVVASCLHVGDQSYFLVSVATGDMSKTAENCKSMCDDYIKNAKENYNCSHRNSY